MNLRWFILLFVIYSCNGIIGDKNKIGTGTATNDSLRIDVEHYFQQLLDTENLVGAIVVKNTHSKQVWCNDYYYADKGFLPASTFKIPNSIIGLEMGIIPTGDYIFKWNGEKNSNEKWNQDLNLHDAFHYSCVPCYRELARNIGYDKMSKMLEKIHFGEMTVQNDNLDLFWLQGESKISCQQQIDFLERFYTQQLKISQSTYNIMRKLMVIEETPNYVYSGKTGWAETDSTAQGWFVGYVEADKNVYFFATHIQPKKGFNMDNFAAVRRRVTNAALIKLNILPKKYRQIQPKL